MLDEWHVRVCKGLPPTTRMKNIPHKNIVIARLKRKKNNNPKDPQSPERTGVSWRLVGMMLSNPMRSVLWTGAERRAIHQEVCCKHKFDVDWISAKWRTLHYHSVCCEPRSGWEQHQWADVGHRRCEAGKRGSTGSQKAKRRKRSLYELNIPLS